MKFLKEIYYYLSSRIFLINFGVAITIFFLSCFIVLKSLKSWTNHNDAITVPNLKHLSLEEASATLESKGLSLMVVDSFYVASQKPGAILTQNISAMQKVKPSRTINVTINRSEGDMILIPQGLFDQDINIAIKSLEAKKFKIEKVETKADTRKDILYAIKHDGKTYTKETTLPEQSLITLVKTDNQSAYTHLPNIIGKTFSNQIEADDFLRSVYKVKLGNIDTIGTIAPGIDFQVINQDPNPSDNTLLDGISKGSQINITIKSIQ